MSQTIVGLSGKIEVIHWHVGDNVRILVYNKQDNSVYFVTDNEGAKRWKNALSLRVGSGTITIRSGRAVAEVTHFPDYVEIVCYDALYPYHQTTAKFNKDQVSKIIEILEL